ncbi:MAG: transposase zinc-binding domain-containing protein, partial [Oligoflexia bacterium]|nr:transposase zinc-binding domain-containing protein [Oligoflexia bacterium]
MTKKTNLFLKIFADFWDHFKIFRANYASKYFDDIVKKVASCADLQEGFVRYQCLHCGRDERVIGFTCKH